MTQLRSYIDKTGIRQAALAGALGISKGYMSELVSGDKSPGRELAVKIERATFGAVPVQSWDHPPAHDHAIPSNQGDRS
ncbi:helix-turn-helix domain-containing protein [Neotabrizicola sp. VNH66]|uniref:helix-turn-helix domain-containing protein n=1 Tax=Neotabrizicola sp. VNH66 TaxID=3400918 RepID=UPI003BFB66B7